MSTINKFSSWKFRAPRHQGAFEFYPSYNLNLMEKDRGGGGMQAMSRPSALLFINTTHPGDATTPGSLSRIRSHAAKEIRSRVRKSFKAVQPPDDRVKHSNAKRLKQSASTRQDHKLLTVGLTPTHAKSGAEPHTPIILPLETSDSPVALSLLRSPSPWNLARSLSDKESFLFDHYLNFVVPFGNGSCHRNKNTSNLDLISVQLRHWIPFALSDVGLIAALLLQSCHSLAYFDTHQSYADMSAEYRLQCIQITNAYLSSEGMQMSDATIALVMIMAFDEFALGNYDGWNAHLTAITQMVQMRGGVDSLGIGGFLKEVIVNTPICYGY